jgi:hypothetical protein
LVLPPHPAPIIIGDASGLRAYRLLDLRRGQPPLSFGARN